MPIIQVDNVSMRFNLAQEKTETLKEYTVKLLKHQLFFNEFYALQDVSFSIEPGESVALIGRNGSGKTTMIKLLCRLYDPTEGFITLNGIDIRKYNRTAFYRLFSAVFQQFSILPVTIAEIVSETTPENIDYSKVKSCLTIAGL